MSETPTIEFASDGSSHWAGMGDYRLVPPDKRPDITLRYLGEPPHGDSYHELTIAGAKLPGFAWGCNFAFTADSQMLAASWMPRLYGRKTIMIEIAKRRFCVLPDYFYDFAFDGGRLIEAGAGGRSYEADGYTEWMMF